jgi:hypothetical protein
MSKDVIVLSIVGGACFIVGLFRLNNFRVRGVFSARNIMVELGLWIFAIVLTASGCNGLHSIRHWFD